MSAEAAESPGAAAERLKRHDSLYGDAEKVSNEKYHGSGVRISASRSCQLVLFVRLFIGISGTDTVDHTGCWRVQGSWARTLMLAFQSIGVVYGDIGTSPLYVYSSTFPGGIRHPDDLLGVLSLILYTLILIPMLKYVFVVLHANDDGDGELIIT